MEYLVLGNDEQTGIVAMCGSDVAFPCSDGGGTCRTFCRCVLPPCCSPRCNNQSWFCPRAGMSCCCYN